MPKLEPMSNGLSRSGRRARSLRVSTSLAEINVVPLVDVMLVLLVIFMVTAPMIQQGIGVNLPDSRRSTAQPPQTVQVTIPATFATDQRLQIDGEWIPLTNLSERIRQATTGRPSQTVTIAADGAITFNDWAKVHDRLVEAGVTSANLLTSPPSQP